VPLMRWQALLVAVAVASIAATSAAADTKTCDAAYDKAQTLRDAKKFVEAREPLRVCARVGCPAFMRKDCAAWIAEAEPLIPGVVVVATDASGAVLADAVASIDGGAGRPLDGTSWDVDPGRHTFAVTRPGGAQVKKSVLVVEGQKGQRVEVSFGPSTDLASASAPAADASSSRPEEEGSRSSFPYRTAGFVAIGVGGAGILVGSILGGVALATKGAHCHGDACTSGAATTALAEGTGSTVAFVVGGLLAAGGVAAVLFAPQRGGTQGTHVEVAPTVSSGGTGFVVSGVF